VGFPQETDEEFEITLAFAKKVRFAQIHIFKYSMRKGTVAAKKDGQVPEQVKTVRSDRLIREEEELRYNFTMSFVGRQEEVLLEEKEIIDGKIYMCGYTKQYVRVAVPVSNNNYKELENKIAAVNVIKVLNSENLLAETIKMY